jgi:hypothetical protein
MRRSTALAVLLGAGLCLAPPPASAQQEADEAAQTDLEASAVEEFADPDIEAVDAWWARSSAEDEAWWARAPEATQADDDPWWVSSAAAQADAAEASDEDSANLEEEESSSQPRRSCATLRKQIAHFEGVKGLADHREDEQWKQGTELHLERLRARQLVQCPQDVPPNAGQRMAVFAAQAAALAYQLFMLGLL